jgi:biotin-dependent carboxylase-like uncharacterized protein
LSVSESPGLTVIQPGLLTVVQDRGRFGLEALGIPRAGAIDWAAAVWANLLALNSPEAAVLEATLLGPIFTPGADCWLATAGAAVTVDGRAYPPWAGFRVPAGAVVSIARIERTRAYLAVHGGIAVEPVLGSRSTDLDSNFGGFRGRAIQAGDILPVVGVLPEGRSTGECLRRADPVPSQSPTIIHVVPGPHADSFPPEAAATLYGGTYRVSPQSSHMAARLDGPAIPAPGRGTRISEPMPVGGIQVTPAGQPIALLKARGTIGGYPLLATIITPDTWEIGQVRPGGVVSFHRVTIEEGQELTRLAYAALHGAAPEVAKLEVG